MSKQDERRPIIPVVDLLGGVCVRGIGGKRETYQPLQCGFCQDGEVAAVAKEYVKLGFDRVYVADLDAIAGRDGNPTAIATLEAAGLNVWLDAGLQQLPNTANATHQDSRTYIVGTETLTDLTGSPNAILSVDLRAGQCISSHPELANQSTRVVLEKAIASGWQRFILLELTAVGSAGGLAQTETCRALKQRHPNVEVILGGGVRTQLDVEAAVAAGADAVLVGTAIYDGVIR